MTIKYKTIKEIKKMISKKEISNKEIVQEVYKLINENKHLNTFVTLNEATSIKKAKNFIDGYSSVRKLSVQEKQSIKILSQGAALRFLLTRVFDALNTVEGAIVKVKDPIEYLKRLEFHKNAKNYEDYFF